MSRHFVLLKQEKGVNRLNNQWFVLSPSNSDFALPNTNATRRKVKKYDTSSLV
jgi:hypothetical protein